MRPKLWLTLAIVASCSSRDESLGQTRPSPQPIIDVEPQPAPDPEPAPEAPPCEYSPNRQRNGECTLPADCHHRVIDRPGYECDGGRVCCDIAPVGCTAECCGPECDTTQGGQGNTGTAGAGANP